MNDTTIEVCDIEKIPKCDGEAYPGNFMDVKETATANFYYDASNNDFVRKITKDLLDELIRVQDTNKEIISHYQTYLKMSIIIIIMEEIEIEQFVLYAFFKKRRENDKSHDEEQKKQASKYVNMYNDGGLQKFVKKILHYDEKNKILSDKEILILHIIKYSI